MKLSTYQHTTVYMIYYTFLQNCFHLWERDVLLLSFFFWCVMSSCREKNIFEVTKFF